MLIKTWVKLLHNQERTAGDSGSRTALPSLSLRKKILAPNRSCIFNLAFEFQEYGKARYIQLLEYDFEIRHRKGTVHGNADALSRKPCNESCQYCSRVEKKYEVLNPKARQVTASSVSKPDPWSDDAFREAQKEDPDIKPNLEFKESFSVQPNWQDISTFSPIAESYWAVWDWLHV